MLHLAIVSLWFSACFFSGSRVSNYESWIVSPVNVQPASPILYNSPGVLQDGLNLDTRAGLEGQRLTSGLFELWYSSGYHLLEMFLPDCISTGCSYSFGGVRACWMVSHPSGDATCWLVSRSRCIACTPHIWRVGGWVNAFLRLVETSSTCQLAHATPLESWGGSSCPSVDRPADLVLSFSSFRRSSRSTIDLLLAHKHSITRLRFSLLSEPLRSSVID